MRLKSLEVELDWPDSLPINHLRQFVIARLRHFGDPIRWAITSISVSEKLDCSKKLIIEAVVSIS
ncbi:MULTISPECIES: hypothetical protein [unclassified Prochlorococcus]|uniref:hypothetical protein n=1 Tax=unclassified Prochlorococcus TaxID=2627481 RepID=UPI000533B4D1|nr:MULTISPECIES: hypothetical protein [unclassified Prochlorococcus]KGG14791.1 hypothetical protein EV06_1854 [Prochlorococcus sp. MIT 0602]KGG15775.1 hypothetical protein EV07_1740 [Prochlorococcus sp. MIT 0603]